MITAIWAALTSALGWLVRSQIGRWLSIGLTALGLQFVATEAVLDPLVSYIEANVAGAGGAAVAWLGFFNVDRYITLILSAYVAAASVSVAIQRIRR